MSPIMENLNSTFGSLNFSFMAAAIVEPQVTIFEQKGEDVIRSKHHPILCVLRWITGN